MDRCENCGRPLTHPTQTCCNCAAKFNPAPFPNPYGIGDKNPNTICPSCGVGFKKIKQINWPENAPWYRFTVPKPACPSCDTVLIYKYRVNNYIASAFYVSIGLKIFFGYINIIHFFVSWLSALAYISSSLILSVRAHRDINKYAIDTQIEIHRKHPATITRHDSM